MPMVSMILGWKRGRWKKWIESKKRYKRPRKYWKIKNWSCCKNSLRRKRRRWRPRKISWLNRSDQNLWKLTTNTTQRITQFNYCFNKEDVIAKFSDMGCLNSRQDINDVHPNIFAVDRLNGPTVSWCICNTQVYFSFWQVGFSFLRFFVNSILSHKNLAF